ncbi:CDC42 small effector protein 2-B-like [Corticium candelabrum]|uniref:CDC42 small effector protein 2-B-like n=1 Tax=Corticium candelabrum TaxID=121492 RepID=UPI002E252CA8|nr:CDC42 small effector protein 2-B-like [Corticium candelabrum]
MADWFLCPWCGVQEEQPVRRRPKIDKSMIGTPENFQHTGHIGSGDTSAGSNLNSVQSQMKSKGGYENTQEVPANSTPDGVPVRQMDAT